MDTVMKLMGDSMVLSGINTNHCYECNGFPFEPMPNTYIGQANGKKNVILHVEVCHIETFHIAISD